jgi:hypothetical protein
VPPTYNPAALIDFIGERIMFPIEILNSTASSETYDSNCPLAANNKPINIGLGLPGRDLNSGWYWHATKNG